MTGTRRRVAEPAAARPARQPAARYPLTEPLLFPAAATVFTLLSLLAAPPPPVAAATAGAGAGLPAPVLAWAALGGLAGYALSGSV